MVGIVGTLSNGQAGVMATDDHGSRRNVGAHVLMIPYPSQPHILPMLDLACQLASRGDIAVTFVSFQVLIDRLLKGDSTRSTGAIHFVGVPDDRPGFNPPSEFPTDPIVLRESLQLGYNMEPFLDRLLQERESSGVHGPTCLVVDKIHWWSTDVASRLSIPKYVLVVVATSFIGVMLSWAKNGIQEDSCGVIHVPGLPYPNLVTRYNHFPLARNSSVIGKQIRIRWPKHVVESDGVLLNTCSAVESQAIDVMRIMLPENVPLLPVGPLGLSPAASFSTKVSMEGLQSSDEVAVVNWLDQQPPLSVVYVSFGTTGMNSLTKRHVLELARGLEISQQRFMWVLRAPPDVHDIADALPLGFQNRVKGRGLLLTGWAPQKLILAHPSTGAFLSSCGWNSTNESLSRGVPLIGWPSMADQPIVSRYMDIVAKVAIDLPQQADYFVAAEDIAKVVKVVLQSEEGKAMRERARKLGSSIAEALAQGGSSSRAVEEFADLIRHRPASTQLAKNQ